MDVKKKTILAIDDDISTLTAIRTILDRNYEISLAKNINIAKTILAKTAVDMILLDMDLPGVSGMDFLNIIHSDILYYSIPVIVVSSYGTQDVIIDAQKYGAVDFVVKPISPKTLLEKIQSGLKTTRKKISKANLYRKLQILESCCIHGKSLEIEKTIKDLELYCYDLKTDLKVAKICDYARELEYEIVAEEAKMLMAELT